MYRRSKYYWHDFTGIQGQEQQTPTSDKQKETRTSYGSREILDFEISTPPYLNVRIAQLHHHTPHRDHGPPAPALPRHGNEPGKT